MWRVTLTFTFYIKIYYTRYGGILKLNRLVAITVVKIIKINFKS